MKIKVLNIIDEKTFKGVSTARKKHPQYGKFITIHKKFLVDSRGQTVTIGDEVEIVPTKPVSKTKKWALKVN